MRQITLRTKGGGFVAVVEIAPFPDDGLPDIVAWGERVFMRSIWGKDEMGRPVYEEAFAHVSFTPSPGLPQ